jgi:hypothetical protein
MLSRLPVFVLLLAVAAAAQTAARLSVATQPGNAPQFTQSPQAKSAASVLPATVAAKPAAAAASTTAPQPASIPKNPAPAAQKPRVPAKKPAPAAAEKVVAHAEAKTTSSEPARKTATLHGKRDPFVSIIQNGGPSLPACSTGKKCLVVDQIILRGVVKGPSGMLAVVENQQRKAYFLRETDPVFNGQVVRITSNSIVFRERVIDRRGREHLREVVKNLPGSKPAV